MGAVGPKYTWLPQSTLIYERSPCRRCRQSASEEGIFDDRDQIPREMVGLASLTLSPTSTADLTGQNDAKIPGVGVVSLTNALLSVAVGRPLASIGCNKLQERESDRV